MLEFSHERACHLALPLSHSPLQFTSGGVDPWRMGAVLQTLDPTVPALTIPGASHCMDLRQANENTLASVNAAQAIIKAYIRNWVYAPQQA